MNNKVVESKYNLLYMVKICYLFNRILIYYYILCIFVII